MADINQRISDIVGKSDVVLFMKGTPLFPQCGFSSRAISILDHCGVAYEGVDVLQDMEIRQGIKAFSDWRANCSRCSTRKRSPRPDPSAEHGKAKARSEISERAFVVFGEAAPGDWG